MRLEEAKLLGSLGEAMYKHADTAVKTEIPVHFLGPDGCNCAPSFFVQRTSQPFRSTHLSSRIAIRAENQNEYGQQSKQQFASGRCR